MNNSTNNTVAEKYIRALSDFLQGILQNIYNFYITKYLQYIYNIFTIYLQYLQFLQFAYVVRYLNL